MEDIVFQIYCSRNLSNLCALMFIIHHVLSLTKNSSCSLLLVIMLVHICLSKCVQCQHPPIVPKLRTSAILICYYESAYCPSLVAETQETATAATGNRFMDFSVHEYFSHVSAIHQSLLNGCFMKEGSVGSPSMVLGILGRP